MRTSQWIAFGAAVVLSAAVARADEFSIKLKSGPGADVTQTQCAACHSLDYILINSPFPKRAMWDAEVNKMIKTFGAPMTTDAPVCRAWRAVSSVCGNSQMEQPRAP